MAFKIQKRKYFKEENFNNIIKKEGGMAKFDFREFLLSLIGVFLGIIGLAGITTILSKGAENLIQNNNLLLFIISAFFVGIAIAILREILK